MRMAILTVLIIAVPAFGAVPQGVDLALLDGWDIVMADDAVSSEVYAAREFQSHFELASGIKLPIVKAACRPDRHIFIGPGVAMRDSAVGFSVDGFGPEDLRIVVRDSNIVIAGGRPRGTLYGVYTFLEDYLGVRFLTVDHTYVPPVGRWRLVGPVDRFYHPPFVYREMWSGEIYKYPVFAARARVNASTGDPNLGGTSKIRLVNHSFYRQLPVDKYGKEHPEYFSLVDGERKVMYGKDIAYNQLCLTNPEVLRIVKDAVLAELKADSNVANISVSQNDGVFYCQCPNCAAVDEREESHMGSLMPFVNAVADEVAKEYPNVLVGTLAYGWSRKPPRTIKPRPNVQIQLCCAGCCQLHPIDDPNCPNNVEFCHDLAEWAKVCKNIGIWNYNANYSSYMSPRPNLQSIGPNVKYFAANNAIGVFMQVSNGMSTNLSDLCNYIIAGMIWDPSRNGEQLMDEFLTLHYGKAAPAIRRFIDLIHDKVESGGYHLTGSTKVCSEFGIDHATAKAGVEIFDEALKLAENETVRLRVEKASLCALRAAVDPLRSIDSKEGLAKLDPALVEWMRPQAKRYVELCKKHGANLMTANTGVSYFHNRLKKVLDF